MALQLQMSWKPNRIIHKRKSGAPLGLKNLGNTCYLNSVLQCLTYTPPLANFCLNFHHSSSCDSISEAGERKRECPFCILEKRIVRSLSVDLTLDAPSKILSCLRIFAGNFRFGHQEDAHEFLRYVIDACHNTCLRLKKLQQRRHSSTANGNANGESVTGSTVVKEIFGGALQSQVKCLSCGAESNKVDEIMDISLDVLHSSSLKEAMQKFFQPEVLDGNNKYRCDNCKKLVAARKQMSVLQAPNVLVIQLKRFESILGGKIDKAISFEEVLVLSSYMSKASQDRHPEYNLFGTIVHSGFSPESGHYYAYIKDATDRWYCCNDSYVSLSTLQEVLSEKVYILFFSRTNQNPVHANSGFPSNGVKSCDSNGSIRSKNPKASPPLKAVHTKHVLQSSVEDISARSKVDKVSCTAHMKLSSPGKSFSKRVLTTSNGNVEVRKKPFVGTNGNAKDLISLAKREKDVPLPVNQNCAGKGNGNAEDEGSEKNQVLATAGHDCKIHSIGVSSIKDPGERNGAKDGVFAESRSDYHELHNGGVNGRSDISGSKRKFHDKDSCILLAKDAHSQEKLEELKELLGTEAYSVLRSCGWTDKVYSLMHSRKKICEREAGITQLSSKSDELKKKLIAEAKGSFISQIPESLKEELVKRLRSISH